MRRREAASPKYSLDIGSFLKGEGREPPESGVTHVAEVETSLNALFSDATPLTSGLPLTALDAGRVASASSAIVEERF